jgi:muramoyltetrapeptide carboxypeptidase
MRMNKTTVRLIAPSGHPHDREAMVRGVERLRDAGCEVEGLSVLDRAVQRYAGSDGERAADINALATQSPLPNVVLAVRGGYGATRLLPYLHFDALRERLTDTSTVLVGHSDFTAVQLALYAKSGLCTFAGPMLGADFGAPDLCAFTWNHFWSTVGAPHSSARWKTSDDACELDVQGPLWGGNLAVLCSLIGTPYFPGREGRGIDDGILFVEDVGEPPFRIERLLYQLHLSGVLGRQRALILGSFTRCAPADYDNGYTIDSAFAQIRGVTPVPVIGGMPMGHEAEKFSLPFGVNARLRVSAGHARLDFSGYPHFDSAVPVVPVENT